MKTNKLFIIAVIVFALSVSACDRFRFLGRNIQGSGDIVSEVRQVSGFERVSLQGFGEVRITQGAEESLEITTDDNILPYVRTEVRRDTLVIDFDREGPDLGYSPTDGIRFDLVVKDLSRVDVSGAGAFFIEGLETEMLHFELAGAGSVQVHDLKADELVIRQSGAGSIIVSGEVKGQDVSLSGAGSYHAADLKSETAIVEISGIGNTTLWVTETLDVEISSIGSVIYYGTPRVISDIGNLAELVSRGEK